MRRSTTAYVHGAPALRRADLHAERVGLHAPTTAPRTTRRLQSIPCDPHATHAGTARAVRCQVLPW